MMEISLPQIKKIKVMQRAMGLDDNGYREMLWGVARVKSCKELKGPKIQLVIKHLEKCLRIEGKNGKSRPQVREIRRLWGRVSRVAQEWGAESRQAHEALNKFLWRRFQTAAPEWLTAPQASNVIEALKCMGRRGHRHVDLVDTGRRGGRAGAADGVVMPGDSLQGGYGDEKDNGGHEKPENQL